VSNLKLFFVTDTLDKKAGVFQSGKPSLMFAIEDRAHSSRAPVSSSSLGSENKIMLQSFAMDKHSSLLSTASVMKENSVMILMTDGIVDCNFE